MENTIIEVRGLKTIFKVEEGIVTAVDGVDFALSTKETLAIVGESGSGKSVTALSILRLIHEPPGKIAEGMVLYQGKDLLDYIGKPAIITNRIILPNYYHLTHMTLIDLVLTPREERN